MAVHPPYGSASTSVPPAAGAVTAVMPTGCASQRGRRCRPRRPPGPWPPDPTPATGRRSAPCSARTRPTDASSRWASTGLTGPGSSTHLMPKSPSTSPGSPASAPSGAPSAATCRLSAAAAAECGGQLRLPEGRVALPDDRVVERRASRAQDSVRYWPPEVDDADTKAGSSGAATLPTGPRTPSAYPVDGDEQRRGRGGGERDASRASFRAPPTAPDLREAVSASHCAAGAAATSRPSAATASATPGQPFAGGPPAGGGDGDPADQLSRRAGRRPRRTSRRRSASLRRCGQQRGDHGEPEPDGDPDRRQPGSAGAEQRAARTAEARRGESWRLDARLGQERRRGGEQVQRPREQHQERA